MNKIYKVIWSKTKNCYVIVSEYAKRNGKCSSSLNKKLIAAFLAAGTVLSVTVSAWAEPAPVPGGYQITGRNNYVEPDGDSDAQTVFGSGNTVTGLYGTAWGYVNIAADSYATVWGSNNRAGQNETDKQNLINRLLEENQIHSNETGNFGIGATAWGYNTEAFGTDATAFGFKTKAYGIHATAWGTQTMAMGVDSTAFGLDTVAKGRQAVAWGEKTLADGSNATAFGEFSRAVTSDDEGKMGATAFGIGSLAMDSGATAFGSMATAQGEFSTAFGIGALAAGNLSTAFGENSLAFGDNSLAALGGQTGTGSVAYNIPEDPENYAMNPYATKISVNAEGAVAIGKKAVAYRSYTYAIGNNTRAMAKNSLAIGNGAYAYGVSSSLIGTGSKIGGSSVNLQGGAASVYGAYNSVEAKSGVNFDGFANSVYGVGNLTSNANSSVVVGTGNTVQDSYEDLSDEITAVWNKIRSKESAYVTARADYDAADKAYKAGQITWEELEEARDNYLQAQTDYTTAEAELPDAVKDEISGKGGRAIAIGSGNTVKGKNGIAIGSGSTVSGENSIAIGTGHTVSGKNSGAFGDPSTITGDGSYAFGNNNTIEAADGFVLGNNASVSQAGGVALGKDSKASAAAGTTTGTSGYDPVTNGPSSIEDAIWRSTLGAVSVGSDGTATRQITNVAAGSADTDAVNVAQLKAAKVEIVAGDNVQVVTDTSDGFTKYTIHALNAIVEAGDNITVTATTPNTTETNGQEADSAAGGDGTAAGTGTTGEAGGTNTNDHTTTYTVSATGGGGIAEISFNGDNKDAQIDSPKVLNIEGGATGELSDGNIGVESDGKDTLTVKLARDIKDVDSITVNKNIKVGDNTTIEGDAITTKTVNADTVKVGGTTIDDNGITTGNGKGPSVTKDGIDGGGKKITNVAPGTADTDAVNVSQLKNASGDIYNTINRLDNSTRKGIAGAAALAALHPMDFNPDDKMQFSAGVGNYRGETAAALGMFYRPDESVMFSIGGTFGNSDNMVNAGITFGLDGTRNRITRSRTAMAHEIVELKDHIARQDEQIAKLTELVNKLVGPEQQIENTVMFPDVPENHWAYQYVEDLQKQGIIEGYPDGLFKGGRSMTRYEFAAMLDRALLNGAKLDAKISKEFAAELSRIYVERISGQDNDRKKVERVRVNNSDSKYPEGKTRDVYGSKIVTEILKKPEVK